MRNIVLSILGVLLVVAAYFGGNVLLEKKNKPKPKYTKTIKTVFIEEVENKEIPIILTANGNLVAKK
jgi:hypothetical protein